MVLGLGERLGEQVVEQKKRTRRMGLVVVCVRSGREFEARWESGVGLEARRAHHAGKVVRGTE
jgi:hypothetical protein